MSKEEKIIKIAKKKIKETGLDINLIFKLPEEFENIKHKYDVAAGRYLGNKTIYLNLNSILNTIQHYKLPANDIIDVVLAHEVGHAIDPEFDFLSHQYNTLFDEYEKLVVPVRLKMEFFGKDITPEEEESLKKAIYDFLGITIDTFRIKNDDINKLQKALELAKKIKEIHEKSEINAYINGKIFVPLHLYHIYESMNNSSLTFETQHHDQIIDRVKNDIEEFKKILTLK